MAPDQQHQDGGQDDIDRFFDRKRAKFAACHAPLERVANQGASTLYHIFNVVLRQFREVLGLGDHQFWNAGILGEANFLPPIIKKTFQQIEGVTIVAGRYRFVFCDDRHDAVRDDRLEERFLVGKVQVEGAFGDASVTGNVLEAGGGEASCNEQIECGAQ